MSRPNNLLLVRRADDPLAAALATVRVRRPVRPAPILLVELIGGESALLLADPKNEYPLVKGIYPDDQLHTSPDGILLTERYLTLEGDILSVDTLYGPKDSARFVGARQGDRPILKSDEVIKLAGNKRAVFTVKKLRLPWTEAKQTVEIVGGWTQ